jgi:hypothetical protein
MSPLCCHRCCRDGELRSSSYWTAPFLLLVLGSSSMLLVHLPPRISTLSSSSAVGFNSLSLVSIRRSWFPRRLAPSPFHLALCCCLVVVSSPCPLSSCPPSSRRLSLRRLIVFPSVVSSSFPLSSLHLAFRRLVIWPVLSLLTSPPPSSALSTFFPPLPPPPCRRSSPLPPPGRLRRRVIRATPHLVVPHRRCFGVSFGPGGRVTGVREGDRKREIENEPRQRSWLVFRNSPMGHPTHGSPSSFPSPDPPSTKIKPPISLWKGVGLGIHPSPLRELKRAHILQWRGGAHGRVDGQRWLAALRARARAR